MVLQGTNTKAWAGTHSSSSSKLQTTDARCTGKAFFLGNSQRGEACGAVGQTTPRQASSDLWSQLHTQRNCKTQMPEEEKESSNYSQTTRTTMFKSKDAVRKGRSVQNSWLKKLCCFRQQPLRQDKEEICCMAGSATTALRPDLLFQVFFNQIRSKNCQIRKLCLKPILCKLAFL